MKYGIAEVVKVSTNEKAGTNKVTGRVIVEETSVGVPDVIVTAYDIDLETNKDEDFTNFPIEPGTEFWNKFKNADRLNAAITNENGDFSFVYGDNAFRSNNAKNVPTYCLL